MVTYFRPNDFRRSVESILTNTHCPFHLSIIDNSHGGLDEALAAYGNHQYITIYRNDKNIGKGAAFKRWYGEIMRDNQVPHFISIDSDIVVPSGWLIQLKMIYYSIANNDTPGILAPGIMDHDGDTLEKQIKAGELRMHNNTEFSKVNWHSNLYRNRYTAGPLFMIDTEFYEKVGGYGDGQIYGEDGGLCKAAAKENRFIGITGVVEVIHHKEDDTAGYREWKLRNVTKDVDHKGFWDQSDNQNSSDQ